MTIKYVCDRCGAETNDAEGFYEEGEDAKGNFLHICNDCYAKRKELLDRFMKELQYGKVKSR